MIKMPFLGKDNNSLCVGRLPEQDKPEKLYINFWSCTHYQRKSVENFILGQTLQRKTKTFPLGSLGQK